MTLALKDLVPATDAASTERRMVTVRRGILLKNDAQAHLNRALFQSRGLLAINVLSSPGSGKTALLQRTLADLNGTLPAAVVVGDLATDNDARRLRLPGVEVIQVTTGSTCHLEATMVARACQQMNLDGRKLLFIENVGNLVCPALFDLGEELRAVLLSVTEGEDKPLKYPKIFKTADAIVISKTDMAAAAGFDREIALANIHNVAPQAVIFELSARTGAGLADWYAFLEGHAAQHGDH